MQPQIKYLLGALGVALAMPTFAQKPSTFVYCLEASPPNMSPALATDGPSLTAFAKTIYNTLIRFKDGSTEIEPSLAESWEVSDDGKTYIFNLRKGVSFHNNKYFTPSRDFNADDVLFSFHRQYLSSHPYHKLTGGRNYEYFEGMGMNDIIESIEKLDDYRVKITLKFANAPFLANLAMPFTSIYSAEYAEKMLKAGTPQRLDNDPIGTGAFIFHSYQKDATVRFAAHKAYFAGAPKIDRLVMSITPDPSVRYAKVLKNECQAAPYPNFADLNELKKNPQITLFESSGLNVGYLAFNTDKYPFNLLKVREALSHAINKKAIIEAVFQGEGEAAKNPLPPTIWGYNDEIANREYDLEKAKALLAEAGFAKGFSTDLWAMPVSRPYNPNAKRMAEIIQEDWKKIGVWAKIVSYEWGEYLKRSRQGEHSTILLGWTGDNGDPDNFLNTLLSCTAKKSGSNLARFCNSEFDSIVSKAAQVNDHNERSQLYKKAQELIYEQVPWSPLAHSKVFFVLRSEVGGYVMSPLGLQDFSTLYFK